MKNLFSHPVIVQSKYKVVLLSGTLLPPSPPRGLQIAKCLFLAFFKNPILEVTSTYGATVTFTLGFCPTIFLGVTIYNVFTLVISVLQWKIGSGGTLVGQICGEHARGKRPLPVGGWVAQTWVTSKCLLRLSSHTFSSPVLLHPFDEALIPVSQEKED